MQLINPYKLFNLTFTASLKTLQKEYYRMALICHPDKGGTDADMIIIHKAYTYIKDQLENCKNTKEYEEVELEFSEFCSNQTKEIPVFREIWELSDDKKTHDEFNIEFNKQFKHENTDVPNPFLDGYGTLMDSSEYSSEYSSDKPAPSSNNSPIDIPTKKPSHKFTQDIIVYDEPAALPDTYGEYQNLKIKKIEDFSNEYGSDYLKSFCEPKKISCEIKERGMEDILKERKLLEREHLTNLGIKNTKRKIRKKH